MCAKGITNTATYINGLRRNQLSSRMPAGSSIPSSNHPHVKRNPNFRLFVSGYFRFFYDKGGAGDWCDNVSFAIRKTDRPALSLGLQKQIRDTLNADAHPVITLPTLHKKPKDSLQIILFSYEDPRWWRLYQGPQGVAVSPCDPVDSRFKVPDEKDAESMIQNRLTLIIRLTWRQARIGI